ncbi:mitochondrial import inner membrane translocase subunit Tim54 [Phycomyces blakesleeanus]|uniref:Mitochondrial import inner membrane translocase subunit TIM54 n=1 Tax=Phycomyces blakesleeanus TaxID=4837 RepID=A0ABR3ATK1_PHYBL
MPLPFGIKAPSKGTVIFGSIVAAIGGTVYTSNHYATESRKRLCDQVSWLAERPCDVHEIPRKVSVYISAPPGDGLEKSRSWFREYVKPILVAGAVDYEIKEASGPGQIEFAVRDEIVRRRRIAAAQKERKEQESSNISPSSPEQKNAFSAMNPPTLDAIKHKKEEHLVDGVLAIGRQAWREVLSGIVLGCKAPLVVIPPAVPESETNTNNKNEEDINKEKNIEGTKDELDLDLALGVDAASSDSGSGADQSNEEITPVEPEPVAEKLMMDEIAVNGNGNVDSDTTNSTDSSASQERFDIPPVLSPVMYIPQENIIGWTNIPYRLFMWAADYQRIEKVGKYVVAAVLNETRPLRPEDENQGESEKVYWIGDDDTKELVQRDTPIVVDDRLRGHLTTYTSKDLP